MILQYLDDSRACVNLIDGYLADRENQLSPLAIPALPESLTGTFEGTYAGVTQVGTFKKEDQDWLFKVRIPQNPELPVITFQLQPLSGQLFYLTPVQDGAPLQYFFFLKLNEQSSVSECQYSLGNQQMRWLRI